MTKPEEGLTTAITIVALSMWFLVCALMSVWAWTQFIQWLAEDVKCP